jgi:hypothetical protein
VGRSRIAALIRGATIDRRGLVVGCRSTVLSIPRRRIWLGRTHHWPLPCTMWLPQHAATAKPPPKSSRCHSLAMTRPTTKDTLPKAPT